MFAGVSHLMATLLVASLARLKRPIMSDVVKEVEAVVPMVLEGELVQSPRLIFWCLNDICAASNKFGMCFH